MPSVTMGPEDASPALHISCVSFFGGVFESCGLGKMNDFKEHCSTLGAGISCAGSIVSTTRSESITTVWNLCCPSRNGPPLFSGSSMVSKSLCTQYSRTKAATVCMFHHTVPSWSSNPAPALSHPHSSSPHHPTASCAERSRPASPSSPSSSSSSTAAAATEREGGDIGSFRRDLHDAEVDDGAPPDTVTFARETDADGNQAGNLTHLKFSPLQLGSVHQQRIRDTILVIELNIRKPAALPIGSLKITILKNTY